MHWTAKGATDSYLRGYIVPVILIATHTFLFGSVLDGQAQPGNLIQLTHNTE